MARAMDDEHDRTLGEAARRGQRAAFDALYGRHAASTWRLGLAVSRDPAAAAAALSSAFAAVLSGRGAGPGSDRSLAVQLASATRAAARDSAHLETVVRSATGVLRLDASQARMGFVCRAFDTLPERWRSALWLIDVEGWSVVDAACVLDMAPAAVEGLLARARLGLREQVLVSGLRRPSPTDCRRTTDCLTGYAAGSLSERQSALVRRHLDGCDECRDRLGALDDLVPLLRGGAVVLPLSLAEQAAARWEGARVRPAARLLALPGGRTLPAWAERAFAGSIAAVVTLGIAAATMLATRDRGSSNLPVPPVAAAPPQVLSDLTGPDFQGSAPAAAAFGPPSDWLGAGAATGAGVGFGASRPAASLPRSQSGGAPPLGDGGTGTDVPPSSSPPPAAPPVDDSVLTAGVAGVGGVAVGEECAGGHAAGTSAGCARSGSSSDTVSVGGSLLQ